MNNSPKFLKIDDRLGRRKIKSQQEMHEDESSINWNIQQQNEQGITGKRYGKNLRKFTLESDRQSTRLEPYNKNSQRNDKSKNDECTCPYSNKISQILDDVDIVEKSRQQINEEIKLMRQMLQQLNDELSNRLNKYKLANITPKGMAVTYESQKQTEIYLSKMENNIKFIQVQQRQIREIQARERLVSDRDYELELEQELQFTQREIIEKKKQKQTQGIIVNRLDGRLGSIKEPKIVKEYKNINSIKHNILHYYKKFRQNKVIIQQVDQSYENLIEKDKVLTNKFNECFKIAEENNLAVKANKNYMDYLKQREELKTKKEYMKKKIEVETRSRQHQCQKLQKEIQFLKKQLSFVDKRQELAQSNCSEVVRTTEEYMQKNKIDKKLISKISYKFSDISLKSSRQRSNNDNSESLQKNQTEILTKKPESRLKIQIKKLSSPKGISKLPSGRYQTIGINQTFRSKNMESMKLNMSKDKQFRIKPTLFIKKNIESSPKAQSLQTQPIDQSGMSNEEEKNIKLRKLHKVLIKKDIEKGTN